MIKRALMYKVQSEVSQVATIQRGQDFHAQEVLSHLCIVLDSSFHLRQISGINVGGSYTKL